MSYDPKCFELAEYFIKRTAWGTTLGLDRLAQTIQDTIEDWISRESEAAEEAEREG